ncbi:DUF6415 family natural product biosynthesis protein [Streptomyces sp. NBC_00286]|uniref:DUF6415 family natural product biosynthesis protein n=1 Tax=Streptomyces sp. NBC_00286 TaxID=2975701 RepID=UPI002E2A3AFE|nr:DUF6415 family natural product biosynthesis protein [Streptomyces sp. NBC_00286]
MKAPRRFTVEQVQVQPPPDIELMRAAARGVLAENAEPATSEELATLTLQLRGHINVLVPEVEQAASSRVHVAHYCALACVGEARMKLDLKPGPGLSKGIAYARRLSRVVNALCDHYQNLGGGHA